LKRLSWATGPEAPWLVQTNSVSAGKFAARSGVPISTNQSALVLVTNTLAGTASFDLRVNSEAGWDYLEFLLNGALLQRWSGDVRWTNFPYTVTAGTNRMEWRYVKDGSFSAGEDAVFIDNVFVPLNPISGTNTAITVSIAWLPNRQAQITVQGQPNQVYTLESSSDLVLWLPLGSKASTTGTVQFTDPLAGSVRFRFYRAVAQ
jgi:hypothetical protein